MADVHIPQPEPGAPQRVGARVAELIESGHEFYATAVTGTSHGRTRRPTLFAIAGAGTVLGTQLPAFAIIAIVALLLLAFTDAVVEL